MTLEEMISGFRKIRREWATVSAEKAGQAVLVKVVELMKRAGMSLEDWFSFMDSSQVRFVFVVRGPGMSHIARDLVCGLVLLVLHMTPQVVCVRRTSLHRLSQNGRGDGKLTALELRTGFERLVTHIARRECSCRAYKCDKIATYGLRADAEDSPANAGTIDGGVVDDDPPFKSKNNQGIDSPERDMSQISPDHYHRSPEHDVGEAQCSSAADAGHTGGTSAARGYAAVAADISGTDDKRTQARTAERIKEEEKDRTAESEVHSLNRGFEASQSPDQQRPHHQEVGDDVSGVINGDRAGGGSVTTPNKKQQGLLRDVSGGCSSGSGNAMEVSIERDHDHGSLDEEERELRFEQGGEGTEKEEGNGRKRRSSVDLLNAGGPVACRKHALEGMVYLGQR